MSPEPLACGKPSVLACVCGALLDHMRSPGDNGDAGDALAHVLLLRGDDTRVSVPFPASALLAPVVFALDALLSPPAIFLIPVGPANVRCPVPV